MRDIFNDSINNFSLKDYKTQFSEKGYLFLPNSLNKEFIISIKKDVAKYRNNFNNNRPGGVSLRKQYFNTFMLSISKSFYDYCTSDFVITFSKQVLEREDFRLKAQRFYETNSGHKMQWHTDTKTPEGFKKIPGIIFICYLTDVPKGEFQYIEGSHKWSQEMLENNFNDDFINRYHYGNIKSFKGSEGDLIIYDTAGVHRAKPFYDDSYKRTSLFLQVDCENNSEPIILNASFIDPSNKEVMKYLGFGQKCDYSEFPECSAGLAPSKLVIIEVIIPLFKRLFIDFLLLFFPSKILKKNFRRFRNLMR